MIPRADRYLPFEDWVDLFRLNVDETVSIPRWNGEDWRDWVDEFKKAADGDVFDIPRDGDFDTFQEWADWFTWLNE